MIKDFAKVEKNLQARGFDVKIFKTISEAAEYLNGAIDGMTVGIGGSATVKASNVYDLLKTHNEVHWHWEQDAQLARSKAMVSDVYLTSANALSETGELVSIDGVGNRVSSMLFGHKQVYYLIGSNKLTDTYEDAVWRARNIAAPKRANQFGVKTPCAAKADKCYDCSSPERICRGMATIWAPMMGTKVEVLLVDEAYGL